jgi:hypothetical protein
MDSKIVAGKRPTFLAGLTFPAVKSSVDQIALSMTG